MEIEHVVPKHLLKDKEELERVLTHVYPGYSLDIDSYENIRPSHPTCNRKKSSKVREITPLIVLELSSGKEKAELARKFEEAITKKVSIDHLVQSLKVQVTEYDLSSDQISTLQALVKYGNDRLKESLAQVYLPDPFNTDNIIQAKYERILQLDSSASPLSPHELGQYVGLVRGLERDDGLAYIAPKPEHTIAQFFRIERGTLRNAPDFKQAEIFRFFKKPAFSYEVIDGNIAKIPPPKDAVFVIYVERDTCNEYLIKGFEFVMYYPVA